MPSQVPRRSGRRCPSSRTTRNSRPSRPPGCVRSPRAGCRRQLWLQVVVRGFWHPSGHLADYYLAHGQPERAVALAAHGLATSTYLRAPGQARGMAAYNLACALAMAGRLGEAAASVVETVSLNPGLRAKIGTEPDLAALRNGGYLDA